MAKKCRCGKPALPGRRTCGNHRRNPGRTSAARSGVGRVHLDARIPALPEENPQRKPVQFQYPQVITDDDGKSLRRVNFLPTNEDELAAMVAEWMLIPGHSLQTVERLTAQQIKRWPDDYSLSALRLIEHDIPPADGYRMELCNVVMFARSVPVSGGEA